MLEIVETDFLGCKWYRFALKTSVMRGQQSITLYAIVPQEGLPRRILREKRSDADFIRQGPTIFGRNHAVDNYQVCGRVSLVPTKLGNTPVFDWGVNYPPNWDMTVAPIMYGGFAMLTSESPWFACHYGDNGAQANNWAQMLGIARYTVGDRQFAVPVQVYAWVGTYDSVVTPEGKRINVVGDEVSRYRFSVSIGRSFGSGPKDTGSSTTLSQWGNSYLRNAVVGKYPRTEPGPSRRALNAFLRKVMLTVYQAAAAEAKRRAVSPSASLLRRGLCEIGDLIGQPSDTGTMADLNRVSDLGLSLSRGLQPSPDELSELGTKIVEEYNNFSSNMLAYISELGKTGDTIRSLLKLPRNLKNPKAWADAWLSGRYGDRLFVADTKELLESIVSVASRNGGVMPSRARQLTAVTLGPFMGTYQRTSTVAVADESFTGLMTSINNLMKWDLWPTLGNVWDMIPLSFVVDWVLPVQDILNQLDVAIQAPYLKVIGAYASDKVRLHGVLVAGGCVMDLTFKYYRRFAHNAISDIRPFTVKSDLPSFSVTHAGDALALLVQIGRR